MFIRFIDANKLFIIYIGQLAVLLVYITSTALISCKLLQGGGL